jgi:molecular chaperone GrpE
LSAFIQKELNGNIIAVEAPNTRLNMKKAKKSEAENKNVVDQEVDHNAEVAENEAPAERDIEAELAEMSDKFLRLYSEFDNYRRRTTKERADLLKSAAKDVLFELLPVADDFDRTVTSIHNGADLKALTEGVNLVHTKFMSVLTKQGLEHMASQGLDFDPEFHEAITKIPSPTPELKGKVVDVIEKGYTINDKVLRYAKVVVGE